MVKFENYTWVKTHKEIIAKLKEYKDRQPKLIDLLEESGVEDHTLIDEDKDGNRGRLSEIDPYTFFCFIYKYGNKKRLQILQRIAKHFEVSTPNDTDGIPSAHALKVMMFPFVSGGRTNEVDQLWDLFEKELNDEITNEDFKRITAIKSVGPTKFTEALFNVDPDSYLPINAQTKPYLKQEMGIDPYFNSFDDYLKILKKVRNETEKPFYQISHEAWEWNTSRGEEPIEEVLSGDDKNLNQILFGPPGTGKTYHTVNKALQIVDPEFYEENKKDRKELTKKYRELLITDWENHKSGQIAMTTFHQSFTYEDFIEGIKPLLIDKNNENDEDSESKSDIGYEIQNGIFKNISELARQESGGKVGQAKGQLKWDREQFNKAEFYKLSLGNINIAEDDEIYQYCINNDCISIGFLWDEDLTNVEESKINKLHIDNPDYDKHDCTSMAIFRHHLKEGYYVVIASGNHKFRAIGKVVGDYFYDKESPIRYPHFRKVKWIAKDLDLPVDLIYNKNFSQKTIYHLRKQDVKPEFFVRSRATENSSDKKPFVLIIDEINRGNIAQIFGELITLIEEDKREGMDEEMSVSLPYSKQPFSVPSNLHIIGTMNTADRSIEALDSALRRRFIFGEMPPKPNVIEEEGALKNSGGSIKVGQSSFKLSEILETINNRIENLIDKDHLIGHSYFMKVKTVQDLQRVFHRNIIPLLEEYFYGDKGKIQLVLGSGFIKESNYSGDTDIFADSEYDVSIYEDRKIWVLTDDWRGDDIHTFEKALNTLLKK